MSNQYLFILFFISVQLGHLQPNYIANFNDKSSTDTWYEVSDTENYPGQSKATIVLQQTKKIRRAVFFTLLNPDGNGAGFAGVFKNLTTNLETYNSISFRIRGQGEFYSYKLVLREANETIRFCQNFEAPSNFDIITLNFDLFQPYFEGRLLNDSSIVLQKRDVVSIGFLAFGGAYLPKKQKGVASMEIDWIRTE